MGIKGIGQVGYSSLKLDQGMEFSYSAFREFINNLREKGYQFSSFPEAESVYAEKQPIILLRHDIDFDLTKALELARIEISLGVKATYFFLVRTEHYSVFTKTGTQIVNQILSMGHRLGLHFDFSSYHNDLSHSEIAQACRSEAKILESWFHRPVECVSFHRPLPRFWGAGGEVTAPLLHTYMPIFTRDIFYCSDSQGTWRYGSPLDSKAYYEGASMQLLMHPLWWSEVSLTPEKALEKIFNNRIKNLDLSFSENCKVYRQRFLKELYAQQGN